MKRIPVDVIKLAKLMMHLAVAISMGTFTKISSDSVSAP